MGTLMIIGIVLIIIALVAYVLGARGVAGMSADLGKWLILAAIVIAVIFAIIDLLHRA